MRQGLTYVKKLSGCGSGHSTSSNGQQAHALVGRWSGQRYRWTDACGSSLLNEMRWPIETAKSRQPETKRQGMREFKRKRNRAVGHVARSFRWPCQTSKPGQQKRCRAEQGSRMTRSLLDCGDASAEDRWTTICVPMQSSGQFVGHASNHDRETLCSQCV